MNDQQHTEGSSRHDQLEDQSFSALVEGIHSEDLTVAVAVGNQLESISRLAEAIHAKMEKGGRLFYLGAGTSGRLGILDASECPPTYGVAHDRVIGLIAGGDQAIRKAVEGAEDDTRQGWIDLQEWNVCPADFVVGISASGRTPYVLGALSDCRAKGIHTGCVVCNSGSAIAAASDFPVEVVVGPEFVTGSTRMKAGTAQKMVLNMLTTSAMIKLGHVQGNKMVDMQLSNAKLVDRGTRMIVELTGCDADFARKILLDQGSVRKAVEFIRSRD